MRNIEGFGVGIRLRDVIGGFIVLALLVGCASTPDANYNAYIEANARAQQQAAAQLATIADADACNGDPTCVVAAKAFAAMAVQGGAGQRGVSQYVRQRGAAENIALGLLGALPGLGQTYAAIDAGRNSVRIAEVNAGREVAIVEALGGVTGRVADAFAMLPPATYVGGNYGDTAGNDLLGAGARVGDDTAIRIGSINNGTQIENDGNFGDGNRQDSPDDRSQRTECEGDGCMGINRPVINPLPEPEEGE